MISSWDVLPMRWTKSYIMIFTREHYHLLDEDIYILYFDEICIFECSDWSFFLFLLTTKKVSWNDAFWLIGLTNSPKYFIYFWYYVIIWNYSMIITVMNNAYEVSDVIRFLHDQSQKIMYLSSWCFDRYQRKDQCNVYLCTHPNNVV